MTDHLSNHLFGLAAEKLFDSECAKRGIAVTTPTTDQTACDRLVHVGKNKTLAVQIKASRTLTIYRRRGKPTKTTFIADNFRRDRTRFYQNGIDIIAFFIEPLNRWHIFRAASVTGLRIRVTRNPIGPMRAAINHWELLDPS